MTNSPNPDSLSKELKVTVDSAPPSPSFNKELAVTTTELSKAPTATEDYTPNSNNPFSAFYSHPTTRTSFEQLRQSHSHLPPAPPPPAYQSGSPSVDLEACDKHLPPPPGFRPSFDPSMTGASSLGLRKPCTVWPGHEHFRMKRKEMKRSRGCWPLNTMGKWQRRAAQLLIVLCIIGLAVGVGVGISLKEGGMINRGANWQAPISS